MNNKKRKALKSANSLLDRVSYIVTDVRDQEEDSLNNMPESLEGGERYNLMESLIDNMDDVVLQIDEIHDAIQEIISA